MTAASARPQRGVGLLVEGRQQPLLLVAGHERAEPLEAPRQLGRGGEPERRRLGGLSRTSARPCWALGSGHVAQRRRGHRAGRRLQRDRQRRLGAVEALGSTGSPGRVESTRQKRRRLAGVAGPLRVRGPRRPPAELRLQQRRAGRRDEERRPGYRLIRSSSVDADGLRPDDVRSGCPPSGRRPGGWQIVSISRQSPWIKCVVDEDQLDVGRLRRGAEALVAGRREHRLIAQLLEVPGQSPAPRGVAVDDHGPGRRLVGHEPGEDRDDQARPGERPSRLQRDQRPGGGELDPTVRRRERLDQRVGPAVRPPGRRGRSPAPAPSRPRRPGRTCRRRSPSRSTSPSTLGPAASAAAKVLAGSPAGNAAKPARSTAFSRARLEQHDLRRHGRTGRAASASRAQPEPEVGLRLAPRDLDRDGLLPGLVPDPEHDRVARELDLVEVILPGLVGQEADGRLGLRLERPAGQVPDRVADGHQRGRRRGARAASETSGGTARGSPIRPRASAASATSLVSPPSSVASSGGTAGRSSRAMFRTIVARLARRQARPVQRLDQRRDGVRARLAEPLDGVILLLALLVSAAMNRASRSGRVAFRRVAAPSIATSGRRWARVSG